MTERMIIISDSQIKRLKTGDITSFVKDMLAIGFTSGITHSLESIQGPYKNTNTNELLIILKLKEREN